jgi:hypothetical protein
MAETIRFSSLKRATAAGVAGVLTLGGLIASAGGASASTTPHTIVHATYPVTGNTHLATPNATVALGPGTLVSAVDVKTGNLTANLKLPDATASYLQYGLIPVTATTQFVNDGPTTGTIDLNTGAVTTKSLITLRIVSLSVAGISLPVGNSCETSTPATVQVTSQPGFNILTGGNLTGTYTIPQFANCGLETLLLNLTVPGSGNTISLTLAKPTFG